MLYSQQAVRDNIRNRQGKRVFYLGKGDQLTSDARDYLTRERIEIVPADRAKPQSWKLPDGGHLTEKPEDMTHLNGDTLVPKTHPRIVFRGKVDSLEAELLLCQLKMPHLQAKLQEILDLSRMFLRCDVLEEPLEEKSLCGMTAEEIRHRSHFPQKYYNQPHFMPEVTDGERILYLNKLRTLVRETELAANQALPHRQDILKAMNRMSSMVYILMLEEKRNLN